MDRKDRERMDAILFAPPPSPIDRMARAAALGAEVKRAPRPANG